MSTNDAAMEPQCIECLAYPDEDPSEWCDCDEVDPDSVCRLRAHLPQDCPTPGRW